jgi:glyoxylase-like metal-dependent hydrolase (beta-lactamase superfamily II)/rhodanese-related sulfurtransferase
MFLQQFFIEGLGCASYMIGDTTAGVAAVIDPQRDVRAYLHVAAQNGMRITHIIETHLHADHVSGNTELAARSGAEIYMHTAARAAFAHRPLADGDTLALGRVCLTARHTPGHTPESITLLVAYSASDGGSPAPIAALTGDLLFAGDVGRPDLTGQDAAHSLAADLYHSLFHTAADWPDSLTVYPGHGAGSLCGRTISDERSTTLGRERANNPALAISDPARFVEAMISDLPEQPGNHLTIKAINRKGPAVLGDITPRPLSLGQAVPNFQRGAGLLDVRPRQDFVAKHVPGSAHIEAGAQLSNRAGFVLHPSQPLVLLLEAPTQYEEVVYSLARVGYDHVVGYLEHGLAEWEAAGYPLAAGDLQDLQPAELHALLQTDNGDRPLVLDVREPWEYAQGHIPGAVLAPLGQLAQHVAQLDRQRPTAVVCASGNRSQSAAALLGQQGFKRIYNLAPGMHGWQSAGLEIER